MPRLARPVHRTAATIAVLLHGRARNVAIGAEHAAVSRLWRQPRAAAGADMHDDAGVLRHIERFRARAVRTGEGRLELQIRLFVRLIRIWSGGCSYHAESIAERVGAKCYGRAGAAFEFLLTFRAGVHCICQKGFKVVDVKVDMNRRPVSLISTNLVCSLGRFASSRFLDQSDLGISTFEQDICGNRSSDLGKSQGVAIKSQAVFKPRNVD